MLDSLKYAGTSGYTGSNQSRTDSARTYSAVSNQLSAGAESSVAQGRFMRAEKRGPMTHRNSVIQQLANQSARLKGEGRIMHFPGRSTALQGMFIDEKPMKGNGVAQRNIEYDSKKSLYDTNSDRPGWLVVAEDALLDEYNIRENLSLKKLEYAKLKMARCHIIPFEAIQSNLAEYLNGTQSESQLDGLVKGITAHLTDGGQEKISVITHWRYLKDEVKTSNTTNIVSAANALLSRLNSVSENLRAGDKYLNSYIQDNIDLFFSKSGQGKYSLPPHGKSALKMGDKYSGKILRTPERKQRVVTSEGPIAFGDMTPDTRSLTESYPFETRQIKSSSVKSRVYGSQSSNPHVRGYQSQPIISPLKALTIQKIDWAKLQISKFRQVQSTVNQKIIGLLSTSKVAGDYDQWRRELPKINQQISGLTHSCGQLRQRVGALELQYQQNKTSLSNLNFQLSLARFQKAGKEGQGSQQFEQHEQGYYHQQSLLHNQDPQYNRQSHQFHEQRMNLLSQHPAVSGYLNARGRVFQLEDQISGLNQEQEHIYTTWRQLNQQLDSMNQEIEGLKVRYQKIIAYLDDLALDQAVKQLWALEHEYGNLSDEIARNEKELLDLQQALSQM